MSVNVETREQILSLLPYSRPKPFRVVRDTLRSVSQVKGTVLRCSNLVYIAFVIVINLLLAGSRHPNILKVRLYCLSSAQDCSQKNATHTYILRWVVGSKIHYRHPQWLLDNHQAVLRMELASKYSLKRFETRSDQGFQLLSGQSRGPVVEQRYFGTHRGLTKG